MTDDVTRDAARYLLDVNTLLALLDPRHVFHDAAHRWAASSDTAHWLTCPLVQNGALRVASQPGYPNTLGTVRAVRTVLGDFANHPRHAFVPDDVSLLADEVVKPERLTPATLTDLYLLLLAQRHGAKLATFDRRVPVDAIDGGAEAIEVIPTA